MLDGDLTLIDLVLDKEILYLDMFGPFLATRLTIHFEQHCAHVILIDEQRLHFEAMLNHEVTCPKNVSQRIVNSNKLSFGGTLRVDFLLPGIAHDHSLSKAHSRPHVHSAVIVDGVHHIHPPPRQRQRVRR